MQVHDPPHDPADEGLDWQGLFKFVEILKEPAPEASVGPQTREELQRIADEAKKALELEEKDEEKRDEPQEEEKRDEEFGEFESPTPWSIRERVQRVNDMTQDAHRAIMTRVVEELGFPVIPGSKNGVELAWEQALLRLGRDASLAYTAAIFEVEAQPF